MELGCPVGRSSATPPRVKGARSRSHRFATASGRPLTRVGSPACNLPAAGQDPTMVDSPSALERGSVLPGDGRQAWKGLRYDCSGSATHRLR
jgi:hypothetical protein